MPKKEKYKIDKPWFIARLKDRKQSMRALARYMRLDIWSVSKMFSGGRKMDMQVEAKQIAEFLGVTLQDVMKHAGVDVDVRMIPVVGYIDENGTAHINHDKPVDRIPGPTDLSRDAFALLCRASIGGVTLLAGWMLFVEPDDKVSKRAVGRLCLVQPTEQEPILAIVQRERKNGYTVQAVGGGRGEMLELDWATPILWIRT